MVGAGIFYLGKAILLEGSPVTPLVAGCLGLVSETTAFVSVTVLGRQGEEESINE